jgi:DNA invertase Pin-like site-specific DNA recombinase
MDKVGIYIRYGSVSDPETMNLHKSRLQLWAKENQVEIIDYYIDDNVSGMTTERTHLKCLLEDLHSNKLDSVATISVSMLFRDSEELYKFLDDMRNSNKKVYTIDNGNELVNGYFTELKNIFKSL